MSRSAPAIDRTSFRRNARERAVVRLVGARLYIAPLIGSLALTFAFFEPTGWRKQVVFPAVATLFLLSYVEWVRFHVRGIRALSVPLNLAFMMLGQMALAFATGGLFSPVIPAMVPMAIMAAVFSETRTVYLLVDGLQVPALWAMAYVHTSGWLVPTLIPKLFGRATVLEHGLAPWLAAVVYSVLLNGAARLGIALREVFAELFDEAIEERDRALALHAEQARALTALSAELAHELKNPLASVKGLSALVARDVQGKAADRLAVLRGEVDRMHGILDELLDFSRPLVPLTMEDVELAELAHEVALLYEATAADRAIALQLHASEPVHLRCDPRKIRQIVINLIQNALDASADQATVEIAVSVDAETARLVVEDRGAGIDPNVAASLFEPGVTTKEHGSGLGLVVARSLARQHGGELALRARTGGGASAELSLPRAPAQPDAGDPRATAQAATPLPAPKSISEAP